MNRYILIKDLTDGFGIKEIRLCNKSQPMISLPAEYDDITDKIKGVMEWLAKQMDEMQYDDVYFKLEEVKGKLQEAFND